MFMKFNKFYFEEYKDQFNYYNLIKKININFRLFFNKKDKIFAVVNIKNNFEICMSFKRFFENILQDLRFYKIENYNKIIQFIDEKNNILETKKQIQNRKILLDKLNEFKQFSLHSKTISQSDINKIIGATKC